MQSSLSPILRDSHTIAPCHTQTLDIPPETVEPNITEITMKVRLYQQVQQDEPCRLF